MPGCFNCAADMPVFLRYVKNKTGFFSHSIDHPGFFYCVANMNV